MDVATPDTSTDLVATLAGISARLCACGSDMTLRPQVCTLDSVLSTHLDWRGGTQSFDSVDSDFGTLPSSVNRSLDPDT